MSKNNKASKNTPLNNEVSMPTEPEVSMATEPEDMNHIVDNMIYITTPGTVELKHGKTREVNLYSNVGYNAKGEKVAFTVWGEYADKALEIFR